MSKLVVISLGKGDLNDGFSIVTAQLWETNNEHPMQFTGSLPAVPEIAELEKRFQFIYQALYQRLRRRSQFEIETVGINNVGEVDFTDICQQLHEQINAWLNSNSFRPIDQQLRARLALDEEFQVIIETSDDQLQKLPWHLWNFFEDYHKAEVALSAPQYKRVKSKPKEIVHKVRILAILGNSAGINVQQDREMLEQLPDASTVFLIEPSRQELDRWLCDKQGWDILFFAGHSQSHGDTAQIHINQTSSLTIPELKNALRCAIARGLSLAIFNSCDGLGLARQLADLHIGQIIVMRQDVPDIVAQEFLKSFLFAFADGHSLHLAVRYARERLQGLEDDFPCASWLPIICQNPAEIPPTWQKLCGMNTNNRIFKLNWHLGKAIATSLVVTSLVCCMRSLGIMQQWELSAFDSIVRMRPSGDLDNRLLVVTVTEADIQAQKQPQKSSLSDAALRKLLYKLEPYQPRAIGLDIYRDFPVEKQSGDLANILQRTNTLIGICKVKGGKKQSAGVSPPPEIPVQRIGFSDVVRDRDLILRRQLLAMTPSPNSPCKTTYSFSIQLARQYLAKQGILLQITDEGYLQLGKVVFKPLEVPMGGYQQLDTRGHQILLNYRSSPKVVQQVSLTQILNGQFNPNWVRDRIVLIGVDAESVKDNFLTPYSAGTVPPQEVPGVIIHAHMVSQILSAVLDDRWLLWVLPMWGEILWLWGWSLVGGIIAFYHQFRLQVVLIIFATLLISCGCYFVVLLYAGWIPLVPSLMGASITYLLVIFYTILKVKRYE
ncbi:CHASE2 domain-containing protein [Scytonema sp. NUACC26]|uniref:CHASE2 domain-containing protein n=1 Tax=Scytonema sp. NUACC26 TaxID=3140176 RepID=UPI0034DC5D4A